MQYVEVSEARGLTGLRLVLTAGIPGPWGEAAKGIFRLKNIPFTAVLQKGGQPNEELVAWTGHRNAPVAIYDDEPARARWDEILMLAERLAPEPRLVPATSEARAQMFGIAHEICGEGGLGWSRRLMMFAPQDDEDARMTAGLSAMRRAYGVTPETVKRAPGRTVEILRMLTNRLAQQEALGSPYLVGTAITAADIYWACFAALIDPLPDDVCPMPSMVRQWYGAIGPDVAAGVDPRLIAHRDMIYRDHLGLPLDF